MKTIKIQDHVVGPSDKYFFDTNIWLYINGPVVNTNIAKQKKYSALLSEICSRGAGLYITSMVVSEYINRVVRIGFQVWKTEDRLNRINADFKNSYRNTEHYSDILADAVLQVDEILKVARRRPDDFHRIDIHSILHSLDQSHDYNDAYIVACCEQDNLVLVSDDRDLQNMNSDIILLTA